MASKKKNTPEPDDAPVTAPDMGGEAQTKWSPPLDVRYTVSDPSGTDPETTISLPSAVSRKIQTLLLPTLWLNPLKR